MLCREVAIPDQALPDAERKFRLAYLSRLTRELRSSKAVANYAGIPHMTLCSMLRKLGLD